MKGLLCIGLVVKDGKEFINKWIETVSKISGYWYIIDNGADKEVKNLLINHPYTKRYLIQNQERNMSRDYQKILDFAREDDMLWIWNIDIDELPQLEDKRNIKDLYTYLINTQEESVGTPLFEMREDLEHYVMIKDFTGKLKHGRTCHKLYKALSHFEFNLKDKHGQAIPHNCKAGQTLAIPIKHLGHLTKELREKKRKCYDGNTFKDNQEQIQTWLEEDVSKIKIKKWKDWENE